MAQLLRILIATEDDGARSLVARTIARCQGARVVAEVTHEEGLLEAVAHRQPQLVFLSTEFAGGKGFELAGALSRKHRGLCIALLSPHPGTVEEAQKALRVGARACLFAPIAEEEIRRTVDDALDAGEAVVPHRGTVLVVMSSKGGVGKSTVAVNLAIALREAQGSRVALVDGDLHFGDAATLMNIKPEHTIHDLNASLDAEIADRFLFKHPTGVEVLSAPARIDQAAGISPDRFHALLNILQSLYDVIVVDASASSLETMLASLDVADLAVLVTTLDVVTLKDVSQVLTMLTDLQFPVRNLLLVGNRHERRFSLDPQHAEKAIGLHFTSLLPQDPRIILAGNRGIPMVVSEPGAPFSQKIRELAKTIAAELGRKDHVLA